MKENLTVLIGKAIEASRNAYAPYSNYRVGSVLVGQEGTVFSGCNVENASYSMAMCAERVAIFKAISQGHKEFEAIAISASSNEAVFPCGACRQVLVEFGDMRVYVDMVETIFTLSKLLPESFDRNQLSAS